MAQTYPYKDLPPTPGTPPKEQGYYGGRASQEYRGSDYHEPEYAEPRYHGQDEFHYAPKGDYGDIQGPEVRLHETPASPVNVHPPQFGVLEPEAASIRGVFVSDGDDGGRNSPRRQSPSRDSQKGRYTPDSTHKLSGSLSSLSLRPGSAPQRPITGARPSNTSRPSSGQGQAHRPDELSMNSCASSSSIPARIQNEYYGSDLSSQEEAPGLQYHGFDVTPRKKPVAHNSHASLGSNSSGEARNTRQQLDVPKHGLNRPSSTYTLGSDNLRGRNLTPLSAHNGYDSSPHRDLSSSRRSPAGRPVSYIDLLNNVPYNQQVAPGGPLNNASLQSVVGSAASLLDTKKTLEMYRQNVKKTKDAAVQYEFAIFMINASREPDCKDPAELVTEAKHILQGLADRAYPFAQYYLGDGYFSGLFSKGKPDYDKAFTLFVGGSKHGHAEAGYRAALCYEFGWGTAKSYPKAVQFYRNAASKNHPGAATRLGMACLRGDMGLGKDKSREGLRWLKRAAESADFQYNSAPFELGLLHLNGYGDDVFKDERYAAQLFTQSAELGHVQANYLMGQAYENGLYECPRDAALSVHFYNGAATRGHAEAMMALCAWYMVGAEPVLEKDEAEAYQWAKQAAEAGLPKAEYAVGYFTEMGIGCRRDPLEANVWYVTAADKGNETAKQRLAIIRAAASGEVALPMDRGEAKARELNGKDKKKFMGIF
ncbi:Hypothetical protein R9X50_00521000 [Acrodontium crateriforme]|uniref:HCP-like protein n=1 Tax=Acrodontium crateriforme TaxID=150365 RepID=A0AAQ3M7F8_9PEZI|nr:Hypothetical protein R9X50_00521000 [Acrodontium crateriforme]